MATRSSTKLFGGFEQVSAKVRTTVVNIEMDDESAYPEGGPEAWLVVLGAWFAMIPSTELLNTLAILQAWIFSTYAFFLYFIDAQTGPILDAYPVRMLVIPGSIGVVASMFLFSVSKGLYQSLLSFGVLGGISASRLFNPSISAVGHWFLRRRALATGVACTVSSIGGVVFPLIRLYASPRLSFG
ncbi:hypothetical protein F4679DRAFT_587761 [Xylaria curta]|nr:hypothetical protein F4679DRAFT_587761 [Xylaria curta]